jgi:hypothetical protein
VVVATYCGHCGELLPDDRDELIAFLVVKVNRLGREVEHLAAHETTRGTRQIEAQARRGEVA